MLRAKPLFAVVLLSSLGIAVTARLWHRLRPLPRSRWSQAFEQIVKPFFTQNCVHATTPRLSTAGIRVDQLDAKLEDRQIHVWEVQSGAGSATGACRRKACRNRRAPSASGGRVDHASTGSCAPRVPPKNGLVRRLTVSQYQNTLRELLQLEDDLTGRPAPGRRLQRRLPQQQGHAATVARADGVLF